MALAPRILRRSRPLGYPAVLLTTLWIGPTAAVGEIKVGGKELQVHGFFQQGFAVSTNNNYLTMRTTSGSFAMTDGGLNISTRLTPRLRIGAQAYSRNIGDLGNGRVQLDWAYADYKFSEGFGIRGGKVKTPLGLFNETQDMEFLHTWALLPQSTYPTDLRSTTIAHVGGDFYGGFGLGKAGRLNWVAYAGTRPYDDRGGFTIGLRDIGATLTKFHSTVAGGDARWTTPVEGLTAGFSYYYFDSYVFGTFLTLPGLPPVPGGLPFRADTVSPTKAVYADFQRGRGRLFGEYWAVGQDSIITLIPLPETREHMHNWYVAGTWRLTDRVEVGSYYSRFQSDETGSNEVIHLMRDWTMTMRLDLNRFWNVKVEGHLVDGFGPPTAFRGFYPSSNPNGLKPSTNLLLLRTGIVF